MAEQNADYGYDIQKIYLEMMLTDAETFIRCQTVFDEENFDKRLYPVAKFLNDYVNEYNTLPTFDMVNASTGANLKDPGKLQGNHYDWLLNEFERFSRHKALERAIIQSADMVEKGEYGPVEDLVKDAVRIGLQKDLGTNYWDNPKERLEAIKDDNGQISTGWTDLDYKLFGGFNKGELNIFAGGCLTGDAKVKVVKKANVFR